MKKTYKLAYKRYAETPMTLEEILETFKDFTIYGTLDNTEIHIVDADYREYLFFELIRYEDAIYAASTYVGFGKSFNEISDIYFDACEKITKLN